MVPTISDSSVSNAALVTEVSVGGLDEQQAILLDEPLTASADWPALLQRGSGLLSKALVGVRKPRRVRLPLPIGPRCSVA